MNFNLETRHYPVKKSQLFSLLSLCTCLLMIYAFITGKYLPSSFAFLLTCIFFYFSTTAKKEDAKKEARVIKEHEQAIHTSNEQSDAISQELTGPKILFADSFYVAGSDYLPIKDIDFALHYMSNHSEQTNYLGLTDQEIQQSHQKVYKYGALMTKNIQFILDPMNNGQQFAIAIYLQTTLIGYVPQENLATLQPLIDNPTITIQAELTVAGGPYKFYEVAKNRLSIRKEPLRFFVTLSVTEKKKEHQDTMTK